MTATDMQIGERIRIERNKLGLTQNALAEMLGLTEMNANARTIVNKIEKGTQPVKVEQIQKLCEIFDCEVGYLLCEFDCPRRDNADIQAVTGLSNEAIDNLKQIALNQNRKIIANAHKLRLKAINALLDGAAANFSDVSVIGFMWDSISTLLFDIDSMDVELSIRSADGVQLNVDPEIHKTVAINALKDKIFERMLTKQEETNNDA